MEVTFLGTSSGGGPSETRNCSSLVCDVLADRSLWMVDCAEGTLRQFALQPRASARLKLSKLSKLFITHMHADHIMGIVPLLRNILHAPPTAPPAPNPTRNPPKIEIYGPAGLRTFVRTILQVSYTRTAENYVVHELLTPHDQVTPCSPPSVLQANEFPGRDIYCSPQDSFWRSITTSRGAFGDVVVDVGPISHRDPCLGYIIRELTYPARKIVILGDTCDPATITPLCVSPSPSLLIHEATDAHIPTTVDPHARRTPQVVHEKALARGHSTPTMAGAFARTIGAERLVLNHIGARFPAPRNANDSVRIAVMHEIERQATDAWGMGTADAAYDFMRVVVPAPASPQYHRPEYTAFITSRDGGEARGSGRDGGVRCADPVEEPRHGEKRKR